MTTSVEDLYQTWAEINAALQAELVIVPEDFKAPIGATSFCRFSLIVPPAQLLSKTTIRLTGLAAYQLYNPVGNAQPAAIRQVSKITEVLRPLYFSKLNLVKAGNLQPVGRDSENSSLYRHDFSLPFTFFGDYL